MVTRFFWPPEMPRIMLLPTGVSWHTYTAAGLPIQARLRLPLHPAPQRTQTSSLLRSQR